MRPLPGVAVTLVNEAAVVPYSAMVPAHIGGEYPRDEITIDLVRLCQTVKVRFVAERVTGIDPAGRRVLFAARPPLAYDALSLGLGSLPARPDDARGLRLLAGPAAARRPPAPDRRAGRATCSRAPGPFHLVVVGGGASGCELALAIHKRLGRHAGFRLTLLQGNPRLLPQFPAAVARVFRAGASAQRGIAFRVNARVIGGGDGFAAAGRRRAARLRRGPVGDAGGAAPACCATAAWPWTPPASCASATRSSRSPTRPSSAPAIASPSSPIPILPKNGVHAVREGAVLFDNVAAFLHERPLRPFRPQRVLPVRC